MHWGGPCFAGLPNNAKEGTRACPWTCPRTTGGAFPGLVAPPKGSMNVGVCVGACVRAERTKESEDKLCFQLFVSFQHNGAVEGDALRKANSDLKALQSELADTKEVRTECQ